MIDLADIYAWATEHWEMLVIVALILAVVVFVRSMR